MCTVSNFNSLDLKQTFFFYSVFTSCMKCFIVVFSTCFDKRLFICFISLLQFTKKYLKNNFLHCEVEMWSVKSGLIVGKLYFKINNTEHHPLQFIAQNNCFSLTHTQNFSLFFFLSFFFVFLFLSLFVHCYVVYILLVHTQSHIYSI